MSKLTQDVKPLTEFSAEITALVKQVKKTKRPIMITENGQNTAVLLGAKEYDSLIDTLELLQEINAAEAQLKAGKGIAHKTAKQRVLEKMK